LAEWNRIKTDNSATIAQMKAVNLEAQATAASLLNMAKAKLIAL